MFNVLLTVFRDIIAQ